jgi:hypothetical protein
VPPIPRSEVQPVHIFDCDPRGFGSFVQALGFIHSVGGLEARITHTQNVYGG